MKPKIVNINILADRRAWVSFHLGDSYHHAFIDLPDNLLDQIFVHATDVMNEETIKIKDSIEATQ
jgi:hypothetical protein